MSAVRFELYPDASDNSITHRWRWRLVARNNKIIADSAEAYSGLSKVNRALDNLDVLLDMTRSTPRLIVKD